MTLSILKQIIQESIRSILKEASSSQEQVSAAVNMLEELIQGSPFEGKAYIAGGWVRDNILGKLSKDIDICVEMEDGGIKFANWLSEKIGAGRPVIFENFGTAMVNLKGVTWNGVDLSGLDLEFVQTRTETYTPEGGRKPQVGFGTIQDDVRRRDFTVNALLYDLTNKKIVDLVGGIDDINNGVIRTPLEPDIIFNEDPLRMLRAVRFAGRYGWKIDPEIEKSIKKNVRLLSGISRERVRDEVVKIIRGQNPREGVRFLSETGLWNLAFPGLEITSSTDPDAILDAVDFSAGSEILFIALLSQTLNKDPIATAKKLKLDNLEMRKISSLISSFVVLKDSSDNIDYRLRKASFLAKKGGALQELEKSLPFFNITTRLPQGFGEDPIIYFNGEDLMQMFNLKEGPKIRELIDLQRELWFVNPSFTEDHVRKSLENIV